MRPAVSATASSRPRPLRPGLPPPPSTRLRATRGSTASMTGSDLFDYRQPEAGPWRRSSLCRAVEAVEHMRKVVFADAGALVSDRQRSVSQAHRDGAARWAELSRVVEQ